MKITGKSSLIVSIVMAAGLASPVAAYEFPPGGGEFRANPGSHPTPAPHEVRGHWYYPGSSVLQHEKGVVGLKIMLNSDGEMRDAVIEQSSGYARLDEAALDYARENYQYTPAEGEAMPEMARLTVKFDLN